MKIVNDAHAARPAIGHALSSNAYNKRIRHFEDTVSTPTTCYRWGKRKRAENVILKYCTVFIIPQRRLTSQHHTTVYVQSLLVTGIYADALGKWWLPFLTLNYTSSHFEKSQLFPLPIQSFNLVRILPEHMDNLESMSLTLPSRVTKALRMEAPLSLYSISFMHLKAHIPLRGECLRR